MSLKQILIAMVIAAFLVPLADAQQRPMRDRAQPAQTGTNQSLRPAPSPNVDSVNCVYIDIRMTIHGLAFFCRERNSSPWVDQIIVFDGGDRPGSLQATMDALLEFTRVYRDHRTDTRPSLGVTYRDPDASAQRICDMTLRYGADIPCYEMMSMTVRLH